MTVTGSTPVTTVCVIIFGGIAQLVEHRTVNPIVTGSKPVATVSGLTV